MNEEVLFAPLVSSSIRGLIRLWLKGGVLTQLLSETPPILNRLSRRRPQRAKTGKVMLSLAESTPRGHIPFWHQVSMLPSARIRLGHSWRFSRRHYEHMRLRHHALPGKRPRNFAGIMPGKRLNSVSCRSESELSVQTIHYQQYPLITIRWHREKGVSPGNLP